MRILDEQTSRLTRALGNVFLPVLKEILPYLNAILMVLTEILNWLAILVGYDESEFDFFSQMSDDVLDFGAGVDSATNSTKKLNSQLRSFDKLNNIKTPSAKSSGGGVGIDPKLLELFNKATDDYLSKFTDVEMKATRIRDKIMEWLGFSKQIDEETGKVSFKFDHITSGTVLGALAVGGFIFNGIFKIVKFFKTLKALKFTTLEKLGTTTTTISKSISKLSLLNKFQLFGGAIGLLTSLADIHSQMNKLADGTTPLYNKIVETDGAFSNLAISIGGATASGILFGSKFGVWGAIIGGATGLVLGLVDALVSYSNKADDIQVHNKVYDGVGISIEKLADKYKTMFAEASSWSDELEKLKNKYEEANKEVKNAKDEITLFRNELNYQDEDISKSQLDELNKKYDNLIEKTKQANKSALDYEIQLVTTYNNTKNSSSESTASQIADLTALANAREEKSLQYINQQKQLDIQYYNGQISLADYTQKMNDLDVYYGYVKTSAFDAEGAVSNFNKNISDIDYKNVDTLKESIKGVSDEFNKTVKSLNEEKETITNYWQPQIDSAQTVIDNYDEITRKGGILTEEQKKWYEEAKRTVETATTNMKTEIEGIDTTIEEISGSYKGFLATVYADLSASGGDLKKENKEVVNTIKTDLDTLKEYEMTGFGKNLFEGMIEDIVNNRASYIPKLNNQFARFGIDAGDKFVNSVRDTMLNQFKKPETFKGVYDTANEKGQYTAKGYKEGFTSYVNEKGTGVDKLTKDVEKVCRDDLGIHSPSKLFRGFGINTVQGYINGINEQREPLYQAFNEILDKVKDKFKKTKLEINISTNIENSFNSILYKLQLFLDKFRSGINSLLYNMSKSLNNVRVGGDNKVYYDSMPYIYVPRFKQGIDYVPNDYYLAYLDEGERVLTKQENEQYSNNISKGKNSQSTTFSPTIIVKVGDEELTRKVLNGLQDIAKDTGKPITIGD